MVSREQALAFVEVMGTTRPKAHFEAVLGYNNVPEPGDFDKADAEIKDRCECFVDALDEYVRALRGLVVKELQKEFDVGGGRSTRKPRVPSVLETGE